MPLLGGGVGAGLALLLLDVEARGLLATRLLAAVVPFTVRLVLPNRRPLSGTAAAHEAAAPALLARWGRLRAARTAAALLAALLVLA